VQLALFIDDGEFTGCTKKRDGTDCTLLDASGIIIEWIQYDAEYGEALGKRHCVHVGKKYETFQADNDALDVEKYFILVARPTIVAAEYERIAFGLTQSACVVKRRSNLRIV
jgi:hypothetical protein